MSITRFYEGLQEEPYVFKGTAGELLVLCVIRSLALLATLVSGFMSSIFFIPSVLNSMPMEIRRMIPGKLVSELPGGGLFFVGVALLSLIVCLYVSKEIKLYRIRRTYVFGSALNFSPGCIDGIVNSLVNYFLITLTFGLASPWVTARNVRMFYRSCVVWERSGQRLDFKGSGVDVLVYLLLTFLSIPIIVLTLGFFMIVLNFMWVKWEQSNILIPDPGGRYHSSRFTAGFGEYLEHKFVSWLLTLLTLGLYKPWAAVSEWKWLAERTVFDDAARRREFHGDSTEGGAPRRRAMR